MGQFKNTFYKMKLFLILFFITSHSVKVSDEKTLAGKYYSVNNSFERFSIMELVANGKFVYSYALGGCQGIVEGTYIVKDGKIKFKNDYKYTQLYQQREKDSLIAHDPLALNIGLSFIPDMSLVEWKIKSNYIKPFFKIDCGCILERGKHIKT